VPSLEWQDNLSTRLASSSSSSYRSSATGFNNSGASPTQRRRLNGPSPDTPVQPDWNDMYIMNTVDGQCGVKGSNYSLTSLVSFQKLMNMIRIKTLKKASASYHWTKIKRLVNTKAIDSLSLTYRFRFDSMGRQRDYIYSVEMTGQMIAMKGGYGSTSYCLPLRPYY
jgi:hypothetical protein